MVPVRGGEAAFDRLQEAVLLELLLLFLRPSLLDELPGGPDEERPEEVEDPGEVGDDRRARADEHGPQDEGYEHADHQHPLLVGGGHRELAHDQDEDEEVVDAQRLLGDVAGEELARRLPAAQEQQAQAEQAGEDDPDDRPGAGLLERDLVRLPAADEEVGGDQGAQTGNGQQPQRQGDVHGTSGISYGNFQRRRCRRLLPLAGSPGTFVPVGAGVASAPPTVQEAPRKSKENPKWPPRAGPVRARRPASPAPPATAPAAPHHCRPGPATARTSRHAAPTDRRGGRRAPA